MEKVYLVKAGPPAAALEQDWPFPALRPVCLPPEAVETLGAPAVLQPVMLLPGQEYARLLRDAPAGSRVGAPLLAQPEDYARLAYLLCDAYPEGGLLLLGHGAADRTPYDRLEQALHAQGRRDALVRTRADAPDLSPLAGKATLAPLLMTAGSEQAARAQQPWLDAARAQGVALTVRNTGLCDLPAVRAWLFSRIRALTE